MKQTRHRTQILLAAPIVLLAVVLLPQAALAAGSIRVNTSVAGDQVSPSLSGDRVVWLEQSGDNIVKTKNLRTGVEETVAVGSSGASLLSPNVSGNRVVWNRGSYEIMMKDLGTGVVTTMAATMPSAPGGVPSGTSFLPSNPSIDGSTVVWEDHRNSPDPGDVYGRNVGGSEYAVAASSGSLQHVPDVSGSNIVWADNVWGSYDIRIKKSGSFYNVVTASGTQTRPSISGDFVAWQDARGSTNDIYVRNIGTNPFGAEALRARDRVTQLSAFASALTRTISVYSVTGMEVGDRLQIGGPAGEWNTIESVSPANNTITLQVGLVSNYAANTQVAGLWDQINPSVYSSGSAYKVVWQDNRKAAPSAEYDIYMYDSATGKTTAACVLPYTNQLNPSVYHSNVVWQDNRSGNWDVYVTIPINDDGDWTNSTTTLHANWEYANGATSYEYAIGTTPGGTDTRGWTPTTSLEATATGLSLSEGQTYYWTVKGNYGGTWTDIGSTDGITIDVGSPSVPSSPAAVPANNSATVYWTASSDALSGVSHYLVYRKTSGDYNYLGRANSTSYMDTGLTNGVRYYYQVRAVDSAGNEGGLSAETSAVPTNPQVTDDGLWTNSGSMLHASWSFGPGAASYQYSVGSSPGGTNVKGWTTTSSTEATATGLTLVSGQSYYCNVKASYGGYWSQVVTSDGITVDTTGPEVPSGLAVDTTSAAVVLNWNAVSDPEPGSGLDHYRIWRSTSQAGPYSSIATTTVRTYNNTGLTNGTTYWYKVSALDRVGNEGSQSAEASATPLAVAPTVTDKGEWTGEDATLSASWTAVAGATGYEYAIGTTAGSDDVLPWTSCTSTDETASGLDLTDGQQYFWSVRATSGGNLSSQVGSSNGITVDTQAPPAPSGLQATPDNNTATLQWLSSTDSGSGTKEYIVHRDSAEITRTGSLTYEDSTVSNGTEYTYRVCAVDNVGNVGAWSNEVTVTPGQRADSALTLNRSTSAIYYWGTVNLSGLLRENGTTNGIATGDLE
ncbi:MAG: hypothetical protein C4521_12260, partial [Actinobacteria bacterium]